LLGSEVYVSLGNLRSINIYILGSAYKPGSYTVSSLSTLTNALFVSGGVDINGSLRNIQVKREGETVATFDFYKLLLEGDTSQDVRLQQGDTIFIPVFKKTARVMGEFKRPGLFELKDGDNLANLIHYAGGLKTGKGKTAEIELNRIDQGFRKRLKIKTSDKNSLSMLIDDGDNLAARNSSIGEVGYIELSGQFRYPGVYTVNRGETLSQLMERAGGLTDQAYIYGAIFTRKSVAEQQKVSFEISADYLEQSIADTIMSGTIQNLGVGSLGPVSELIKKLRDLTPIGRIVMDVNPLKLKSDPTADFEIKDGDKLQIPKRPTSITIVGEVISPNSTQFKSGNTYEQYIKEAGGLKDSADKGGVFAIMPNGEVKEMSRSYLFRSSNQNLIPGATIVVPRNPNQFDWLVMAKTITPILADSATAIATVEALLK
jgi:polysaccharide export outer membrane protein